MNLLVTGAHGFIGSHLCRRLAAEHKVFAVARGGGESPTGVHLVVADLEHRGFTETLPAEIDVVVALAQSRHYREFPDQARDVFNVNVASLLELLDWSRRGGVRQFVYASSASVHAPSEQPLGEAMPPHPASFYGRTKRMAEMAVESYADFFSTVVLRLFTVYGPGQANNALVPLLMRRIRRHEPVTLDGQNGLWLSPIYVDDVCDVIRDVLTPAEESRVFRVLNVGSEEPVGLRQLAETIGKVVGRAPRFESRSPDEPGGWIADMSKWIAVSGRRPKTSLETGLRLTADDLPASTDSRTVESPAVSRRSLKCDAEKAKLLARTRRSRTAAEPFTWDAYAEYLDLALEAGYTPVGFEAVRDGRTPDTSPFILLRHDIDYDPSCVEPISRLEASRGILATYFFQPASPFYTFEHEATQRAIGRILDDGHDLGLHFDATQFADDTEIVRQVDQIATDWEQRYKTTISAVSFHMPTHRPIGQLKLLSNRINTYTPEFFARFAYISDSNQDWRGRDLGELLTIQRPGSLQWLTHPMWWRGSYTPMLACLAELAARLGISVDRDILTPEQRAILQRRAGAA